MQDPNPDSLLRLLIVDDDTLDLQATRRALQKTGLCAVIDEEATVAGALAALGASAYDCALLDFTLPDGDGLILLIEAQARGITTPLIMLTGLADEMVAVELMKAGAADYIPKARVSPESLGRAIQGVRRLHEAQEAALAAEDARRASEARFLRVAESNIIGIVFWEMDGTITDANDAFLQMVGYTREELAAGTFNLREMTLPEYQARDDEKAAELSLTGRCIPWEKELHRKDGSRLAVLVSASFLQPPDRKGLAFMVDITERKRVQDAQNFLAEASAALSSSPHYQQTLPVIARLTVPAYAEYCAIDVIENGHADRLASVLSAEAPDPTTDLPELVTSVLQSGQSQIKNSDFLCVPLLARGTVIGAITWVCAPGSLGFGPADMVLAEQLAERVSLAIDNARLLFETQARAEREALLNSIGHALRASLDTEEILRVAVDEVGRELGVSRCLWCWVSPARDSFNIAPQQYVRPGLAAREGTIALRNISSAAVAQWISSDAIVVHDFAHDPDAAVYRAQLPIDWNLGAFLASPVHLRGERVGLFVAAQSGEPRQWTAAETTLLRQVCDLLAPALENAQLYAREHRVADMLQAAFLSNIPDELLGLELATVYRAGLDESQVGGDCYDVFPLPDGRVALVIADVSGKGLSAAVLTATVKYSLRAFAAEVAAPSLVLTRLNRMLCSEATSMGEHFVTLFYAVFDQRNGRLTYASAGHETQIIKRVAGTTLLEASGPILGIENHNFDQCEEHLEPGDALILYTDGLTEARNPQTRELLDVERVAALVRETSSAVGAGGLTARLEQRALEWAHGRPHDDMALLVARRIGHAHPEELPIAEEAERCENLFHLTFSSRATYAADVRQAVAHWMETLQFDRHATEDFLTAVTEAVTNAVRHGSPQGDQDEFEVLACRRLSGELEIEIRDRGPGLGALDTECEMPEPDAVSGRGLPLMRAFADEVTYEAGRDGLCVRLVKRLHTD